MAETSRFWNGTAVGDAATAPYDAPTEFSQVLNSISNGLINVNAGGIFRWSTQLAVAGVASPLSVGIGIAMVEGTWYYNDAAASVVIPTPAAGHTRVDRIVLRKSWAAQTVRITVITGIVDGAAPALTQVVGTTYDIPLAQAAITDAGVITLTDEREFIPIANLSITDAMIVAVAGAKVSGTVANATNAGNADTVDSLHGTSFPVKLAEFVLAVDTASPITFTAIPATYRHLKLVIFARGTGAGGAFVDNIDIRFNNDVGNNYNYSTWDEPGPAAGNVTFEIATTATLARTGFICNSNQGANHFGYLEIDFPNYSAAVGYKMFRSNSIYKDTAGVVISHQQWYGYWADTSAINRIDLILGAGNYLAGSVFTLYGLP